MNSKKSINHTEYAAVGLSVLGTVAAVVTQQIAYVATPLTLSLSLSLINRQKDLVKADRRIANLEQQLTSDLKSVVEQSKTVRDSLNHLPPAPTTSDFHQLSKSVMLDRAELKRLGTSLINIEKRGDDLSPFLTEIDLTKDSLQRLSLNFSNFEKEFNSRQDSTRVTSTERIMDANNLYTIYAPDAVSQSTLDNQSLQSIAIDSDRNALYLSIEQIKLKLQFLEENLKVSEESLAETKLKIQSLEDNSIASDLVDRISELDTSLGDLHDYNLRLTNRIDNYQQYEIAEIIDAVVSNRQIEDLIQHQIGSSNQKQLELIQQILPATYSYTLVSGRTESRQIFLDALAHSQERLILVCPWLTDYAVNQEVWELIKAALDRGVSIEIGWGHLKDVKNDRAKLSKEQLLRSSNWAYNAVPELYKLQLKYPNLLELKILGTHEKFLVCDRQFAMLGSHNYLTSDTKSSEREVGLKTDSPELIDKLIALFDRAET